MHPNSVFDDLGLVEKRTTRLDSLDSELPRKSYSVSGFASFLCWPEVPVPGPVLPLGTSGVQLRSHCRLFSPGTGTLSSPEIWTGSRTGSTGPPEVPVIVAVLPLSTSGGNFRRHFRLFSQVLDVLESPVIWTGSSPGTTVPPEVPVLLPEVPPLRVFSSSPWQSVLVGPVLPVPRVFFSSRW